jgi:cell division protein FtsI (penicillin-binding protein 3)
MLAPPEPRPSGGSPSKPVRGRSSEGSATHSSGRKASAAVPGKSRAPQASAQQAPWRPASPLRSPTPAGQTSVAACSSRVVHPERRVRFLLLTGLFVLSLFAAQLFRLQALDSSAMANAALKSRLSIVAVPALRGDITAYNGEVLATSIERRNVTADQTAVPTYKKKVNGVSTTVGVAGAAADLAPILGKPAAELAATLTGTRRFVYVAKDISVSDWRKVQAMGIPGIYSEPTSSSVPTRRHPRRPPWWAGWVATGLPVVVSSCC